MDFRDGKKKMGKSDNDLDRLSMLPDDLIHKILSFISSKETVRTSAWSSRYRFIWTTMPYFNFSTYDFPEMRKFSKFVTQFLKRRNSQIDVCFLELRYTGKVALPPSVKKLMDYAFSHSLQQLNIECLYQKDIEFPLSVFTSGCRSLKHLSLKNGSFRYVLKAKSTLELPALTTLYLRGVAFCSNDHTGLLSKCANLKNLTLDYNCKTEELSIFHSGLANLTIDVGRFSGVNVVNVVAPQLENLTIRSHGNSRRMYVISAPNLASLAYRSYSPLYLSTDGFHCLNEADIWVIDPDVDDAHQMVCLLQLLRNVRFLTLNLEIIELLSSSVELISQQPSTFVNLKSLTIFPKKILGWETKGLPKGKVNLSTEVKRYLLDGSPGATLTMFSREEIIAIEGISST
uniref:F-box/LRR-repeat protein At1g55660-like isoform X2 n=1 Tax=Erigeron canadensis TaxID=72917 RepID=UPI001CB92FD4|nr:F-box/LRR-repeat protein At1g55660-like isoform X2 [Erigeron canadensis]